MYESNTAIIISLFINFKIEKYREFLKFFIFHCLQERNNISPVISNSSNYFPPGKRKFLSHATFIRFSFPRKITRRV